ncbi:methyltransferase domain-containing protein [Amycolatopsis sp. OK19-0408]|uniref:Methyltransferase domain-containing protein n=1 Tax=Amycolatopsis iheyensis TaxID=2945988 RepID=A0A9X2SNZ6_9PSEU|nr:methyltransferase domain-containing protein [Amycolatopsis iheyensis]MCR6489547.1 methyltransferase domain-containing protein [Amycolatopsis iheyensis]
MTSIDLLADALSAYRSGARDQAAELAARAGRAGSTLADELRTYLTGDGSGSVYDQPSAFTAFIRGGGNVELYRALSAALATRYDTTKPESLLDLGCGDGLAVVPALEQASHTPARIDLVEPSAALLDGVHERVPSAQCWQSTAQDFLARDDLGWDFVQSTFALQSIEPEQRAEVLRALQPRAGTLVLAEFDVPEHDEGSPEHLRSLVERYERGVAEYGEDASLVAQGFLLPVLLGIVSGHERTNWEQPAAAWAEQLKTAGFTDVGVEPLADYWWSPAVLITAC